MERVDLVKSLPGAREAPVLERFSLVQFGPREHEPQLATTKCRLDPLMPGVGILTR
jgi:hypothetical protein